MTLPRFSEFFAEAKTDKGPSERPFEVDEKNGWQDGYQNIIAGNEKAEEHVADLRAILEKPRSQMSEDEKLKLKSRYKEHGFDGKGGKASRKEQKIRDSIPSTHKPQLYHLPGAGGGLSANRITLVAAHAKDGSGVQLISIHKHS